MNFFSLHPNVYSTGRPQGLIHMLEDAWIRNHISGQGTLFIISGFSNYNGGVRFYDTFTEHINNGGRVIAIFGGSTSQRLSSKQVVEELISRGVEVYLINRKRILHAKMYGVSNSSGESLIISSGNFTGPGMAQNIEASLFLAPDSTSSMGYSWDHVMTSIFNQSWQIFEMTGATPTNPGWNLLYDERPDRPLVLDETQEVTLVITLGHADTARIQAIPNTPASLGTQYFWLSKDSFDFFPALTIRNTRGIKPTFSCIINMNYIDIGLVDSNCRVTFEAGNNVDFRLGTGRLRGTQVAAAGDIASITRIGEYDYEMRIFKVGTAEHTELNTHAINYIGNRGKRYGYLNNDDFGNIIGVRF